MTIKVQMNPMPHNIVNATNGIQQVLYHYNKYSRDFGIEYVKKDEEYDLIAGHAGTTNKDCSVLHSHGLYWSGDYNASQAELKANKWIVESARHAKEITVPSEWVAETFRRDMRINPHVIPHGIDVDLWENKENKKYVLWNKERAGQDVCDPTALANLAKTFPGMKFVSTFIPEDFDGDNVNVIGKVPHIEMKKWVEECGIYVSLVKETFGIGILEAMAAGKPILGWAYGGNSILVEHGINGYLAEPDNYEDLYEGLQYCTQNWRTLGENSREMAGKWDWPSAVEKVANVYKLALDKINRDAEMQYVVNDSLFLEAI